MIKRVPQRRIEAKKLIPGTLEEAISELRQVFLSVLDPQIREQRMAQLESIRGELFRRTPEPITKELRKPWPSSRMVEIIFNMTWRILVSAGPTYFITTDSPAYFFRSLGLGTRESELAFPLSSHTLLHGSWQRHPNGYLLFANAPQSIVKEMNRRLAHGSTRLAFYHKDIDWLLPLMIKPAPHLSRIRWQD